MPLTIPRTRCRAMGLFLGVVMLMQPCAGQDWRTWRGTNQDGHASVEGYFGSAPFGLSVAWEKRIGTAYSSLAASRGRLLVPYADGVSDWLAALDGKTGEELWRYRIGTMYPAHDGGHDGPLSTPATDGESVFFLGPRGRLFSLNLESGSQNWSINLVEKFGAEAPFWGFSSSPTLNDRSLFVHVSGKENNGVMAFDKRDGTVQWKQRVAPAIYRSPIRASLNGVQQLICGSQQEACGLDRETGEKLWAMSFECDAAMTPMTFSTNSVLLATDSNVQRVDIREKQAVRKWSANELRGTYATPVFHNGFLYGFSHHALTCVDAATGKRVWRSRAPGGGKGLILVDDHLVVFSAKGDLIVIQATHNGYVESARVSLSSADGYATPIFADGLIFVRSLSGHLFAVGKSADEVSNQYVERPVSKFSQFVESLATTPDKKAAIDSFMAGFDRFPIVENDRMVHFVYRGKAKDVAVRGSMIASGEEDAMRHIEGTDFFYRTYEMLPGTRWEYDFVVDFDESIRDSLNEAVAPFGSRRSELQTPGWSEPPWAAVKEAEGKKRGQMEEMFFEGGTAKVYLPHGYSTSKKQYKLLVVTEGDGWLRDGKVISILDQVHQSGLDEPMVVVFLGRRGLGGSNTSDYARQLAGGLVTAVEKKYRVRRDRDSRIILGKRGAAVAATYTALRYPDVFGHCIAISYGRADTVRKRAIKELAANLAGNKPTFHIVWNRYDVRRPQSFDCRNQSREVAKLLKAQSFDVTGGERNDSANWRSWRIHFGASLLTLKD